MKPASRTSGWLVATLIAALMVLAPVPALAADQDEKKPLKDNENPLLIGKREINKHQLDFYSLEKEAAIGRQLAAEVERNAKIINDPVIAEYINRVGQNIVLHSDAKVPFTIKVIDSADVNAFALPGGFLYVNTGLMLAADNEAEVAGVMAHEIAHVAARHGVEQASKGALLQYLSIPLIFLGGVPGLIVQNAANVLVPLTFLKFSRGAEEEADRLGLQYMWAAGYDPTQLLSFFEKLKSMEKKEPGSLAKVFSTHPTTGGRIEKARALLARFPEHSEYIVSTSEFDTVKSRLLAITNQQKLGSGERRAPTLKRKPTLKRGDSDNSDSDKSPPTLKRKPETDS